MAAIITKDTRLHNARQFLEAVSETANTAIYTFVGKPSQWLVENAPETPLDTYKYQAEVHDNMMALKRVSAGDVTHAIPRNAWGSGTVYYQYNDTANAEVLFDSNIAVINSSYQVFKCLNNNTGTASTVEPSGTGLTGNNLIFHDTVTQDGYIWKYMYTIGTSDWAKFGTTTFIPVKNDATVTTNAANASGIYAFRIVNSATAAADGTYINIVGNGQNANAQVIVSAGTITGIKINDGGTGYTVANVTNGTLVGNIFPIVTPPDGHGYDAIDELGGVYAMVNTRLEQTDTSIPVTGFKFRQVGLLKDPFLFGTTVIPTSTTANTILTAFGNLKMVDTTLTNSGFVTAGNVLTGQTSGANATIVGFTGNVINIIRTPTTSPNLQANYTEFSYGETVAVGTNTIGVVASAVLGGRGNATVRLRSGEVIYIDNRNVITRASDQVEDIHIVLEF
jgi:hypothetical protein